ncbi:PA5502 family lipoprotein [Pseudomonas sp. LFM046]|uniref:PA5502 family lipoprotein n=1 Tax=Pseudomonas sp. LFM046 TaxID=1608357 RepID=UPI0005CFC8A5|nr:PA5502 family lipoprotein [Pseudomonas sp. LFM046]
MKLFATRCLPVVAFSLLLAACQTAQQTAEVPTDGLVTSFRHLDQDIAEGKLTEAEGRLKVLESTAAGDTRLEQYQRQLADAWLTRGQNALQQGDLDNAAKSLSHARSLMPQAPALTTGLDGAIGKAREAAEAKAEEGRRAAEAAAAKENAARLEHARQLREAAERQAAAIQAQTALPNAPQGEKPQPAKPLRALTPLVEMPMLDRDDNENLRRLLDGVAADIVAHDCAVQIQVREAKDYPWVAALLSARVKKLDPGFKAQYSQALNPDQVPRLVLSPRH